MKKNVLVFSGGAYPAIQIYYCLINSLRFYPIAASSYEDHAQFVYKEAVTDLPYIYEEAFIERLNRLIRERQISYIIPTHDTIALYLTKNQSMIEAEVVCSPYETAFLCRYKSKTYEYFKGSSFTPDFWIEEKEIKDFPVFAKPDDGQGSVDCAKIENRKELSHLKKDRNYIFCEYLPGEELTLDCFTDRNRKLLFVGVRTRERIMNGISARSRTVPLSPELKEIAEEINEKLVFRGGWFIQLKKGADGRFRLLEISTRLPGTFGLSKALGVNFPLLALCDREGLAAEIDRNEYQAVCDKSYIDRYRLEMEYDRVYIDLDDTLIFDRERVNPSMIAFLYQCRNKGKEIVLITRHEYEVEETLKKNCICRDLFHSMIHLGLEEEKYQYMDKEIRSIFIDNSFAERKKVKEHMGFFTFDTCNIDALIDWSSL